MAHYNDEVKLLRSDLQRHLPSRYSLAKFNSLPAFVSLLEPSGLRQPIKLILGSSSTGEPSWLPGQTVALDSVLSN